MFNNDDLRGELFKKVGVEETGDPVQLLNKANDEKKMGNMVEAKKIYKQLIEITKNNAIRYEGQSQHRATAQEYYIQTVAFENLQMTDEARGNYGKVIDNLLSYAKTAIAFNEDRKGFTSSTLAGLVSIVAGDDNKALEIYTNFMEQSKSRPDSAALEKILYSLGYIIDAYRNTNIDALSTAQNYISTDLKPMLTPAKLVGFNALLDSAIKYVQDVIESQIKMPNIQLMSKVPRDLLFNDLFEFSVKVENTGEGVAHRLEFNLKLDEGIELVNGKTTEVLETMEPGTDHEFKYTMRLQTGDTSAEIHKKMSGNMVYVDMLNNSHKQYLGTMDLEFRAISKTDEYMEKVKGIKDNYTATFEEAESLPQLKEPMKSIFDQFESKVTEQIQAQEYEISDFGFIVLEGLISWQKSVLIEGEVADQINSMVDEKVNAAKEELTTELTTKHEEEMTNAISKLTTEKDEERKKAVEEKSSELTSKFDEEKTNLVTTHDEEMKKLQQTYDNQLKKQYSDLEMKLKGEFAEESNKKSDEFEKTLNELKLQNQKELEEGIAEKENKLKDNFDAELKNLRDNYEDKIRRIETTSEEEKENALKNLTVKLNKEKEEEIEEKVNAAVTEVKNQMGLELEDLKAKLKNDVSERDAKIEDLERKIRELEASS